MSNTFRNCVSVSSKSEENLCKFLTLIKSVRKNGVNTINTLNSALDSISVSNSSLTGRFLRFILGRFVDLETFESSLREGSVSFEKTVTDFDLLVDSTIDSGVAISKSVIRGLRSLNRLLEEVQKDEFNSELNDSN